MNARARALGLLVAAAIAALGAAGCTYKPVQMGGPLFGDEELKGKRLVRKAQGEACSALILYMIPAGDDSMEKALERLTKKGFWSSDVITIEQGQGFWLLGTSSCTRITAYGAVAPATKFKTTDITGKGGADEAPLKAPAAAEEPAAAE